MRSFFILALSLLASANTRAADRHSDVLVHRSGAPSYSSGQTAVGVADTYWVAGGESITAMFSSHNDWIQTYFGIYSTKSNFDFAVGGVYKFTVAGTRLTGFHVGPGFSVGTVADEFAFAIYGAAGGHFTLFEHLLLSVDAGPMLTHTKNNTNFKMRSLGSSMLGLGVLYLF